ncbi:MAG: multiple sugar transport system permease protein [Microbacteriaceae bacterium]|jgi:multiple sugar transport system permease protein|nr:multiple sugar transport system permease protein [Microbacteriaceae bacterium]
MTSIIAPASVKTPLAPRDGRGWLRKQGRLVYVLPAAVFLGILAIYPLFQLVRMSLSAVTSSTLQDPWDFIGFGNFVADAQSGSLWAALGNTAIFAVIVTVIGLVAGFASAVALRGSGKASAFLLGLMVFIWALPPVVNGSVWKFLLGDDGLFNTLIRAVGITHGSVPFLYDQHLALYSVALVNSWAIVPFNALVFRAAILGIPGEVFEAAKLDGARPFQEIRYILIPAVRPTTLVLTVLTVVYAFRSFDFIYVMTYGGPGTATNTLPFLGYLQAFVQYSYGTGSATAVIAVLLVVVLAVVYARSVRKEESE